MSQSSINYHQPKVSHFYKSCFNVFAFIGLALFTLSLSLTSFFTSTGEVQGIWILLIGWLGVIFTQVAWLANPINFIALLVANDNPKIAILLGMLSLLIASEALWIYDIPTGFGGEKEHIKEFGLGLYVWCLSHVFILLALISNYFDLRSKRKRMKGFNH